MVLCRPISVRLNISIVSPYFLSGYVEAMGGNLQLVAEFPDRPPVFLTGLAALDNEKVKQASRPSKPSRAKN